LDPYRRASLKILEIFRSHCDHIEKASIDESFLDMSTLVKTKLLTRYSELALPPPYNDTSYPLPPAPAVTFSDDLGAVVPLSEGHSEEEQPDWDDVVMMLAAEMIRDVRREVEDRLGYTCSAGIARNKMLAKLAAGWKKPNQQVSPRQKPEFISIHFYAYWWDSVDSRLSYEIAPCWGFSRTSSLQKYVSP
jgi:DNA polymerase eta